MGFAWVQDVGAGASIDSADITEVRANVDTTDDEKCAVHCPGDYADYDNGVDATNYPGYVNDENTGYQSGDKVGVDATNYPGYLNDDDGTYQSGYQFGVDTTLKTGDDTEQWLDYWNGDLDGVLYGENYGEDYGEYGTHCEVHAPA